MEEVATCECGCQVWRIFVDRVECDRCGSVHRFATADQFHQAIEIINEFGKDGEADGKVN